MSFFLIILSIVDTTNHLKTILHKESENWGRILNNNTNILTELWNPLSVDSQQRSFARKVLAGSKAQGQSFA